MTAISLITLGLALKVFMIIELRRQLRRVISLASRVLTLQAAQFSNTCPQTSPPKDTMIWFASKEQRILRGLKLLTMPSVSVTIQSLPFRSQLKFTVVSLD
jgi:hypothetical protein